MILVSMVMDLLSVSNTYLDNNHMSGSPSGSHFFISPPYPSIPLRYPNTHHYIRIVFFPLFSFLFFFIPLRFLVNIFIITLQ